MENWEIIGIDTDNGVLFVRIQDINTFRSKSRLTELAQAICLTQSDNIKTVKFVIDYNGKFLKQKIDL